MLKKEKKGKKKKDIIPQEATLADSWWGVGMFAVSVRAPSSSISSGGWGLTGDTHPAQPSFCACGRRREQELRCRAREDRGQPPSGGQAPFPSLPAFAGTALEKPGE